jgi:hypothetical protein
MTRDPAMRCSTPPPCTTPKPPELGPVDPHDRDRLLAGVMEAVDTITAESDPAGASLDADGEHSKSLLRLLTFCYAMGLYASSEIESALNADPLLLFLAEGERHESTALRRFRRRHRHALTQCLERALEYANPAPSPASCIRRLRPDSRARASLNRWEETGWSPGFGAEASQRVQRAILNDSASLDE